MALFTYSVKYRYLCEKCGKKTDWLSYVVTQDAGNLKSLAAEARIWVADVDKTSRTGNLADTLDSILTVNHAKEVPIEVYTKDNQRIKNVHDTFHAAIETGDYSILKGGEKCPTCGERQSWRHNKSLFGRKQISATNASELVEIDWNSEHVKITK